MKSLSVISNQTLSECLSHHEVGQQNVRRIVCDLLTLLLTFLAGVAPHYRLQTFEQAGFGNEILDLLELAVGQ